MAQKKPLECTSREEIRNIVRVEVAALLHAAGFSVRSSTQVECPICSTTGVYPKCGRVGAICHHIRDPIDEGKAR